MWHTQGTDRAAGLQAVRLALASRTTPALRAVAVKVDKPVIWTRFCYDGDPTPLDQELAEATGEEVGAAMSGRWLSEVLLRSVSPREALVLEPGEEWAYTRPVADASAVDPDPGPGDDPSGDRVD